MRTVRSTKLRSVGGHYVDGRHQLIADAKAIEIRKLGLHRAMQ